MFTVSIMINTRPIITRSATNTGREDSDGRVIYHLDSGIEVKHKPEDGAVALARKILDTVQEP